MTATSPSPLLSLPIEILTQILLTTLRTDFILAPRRPLLHDVSHMYASMTISHLGRTAISLSHTHPDFLLHVLYALRRIQAQKQRDVLLRRAEVAEWEAARMGCRDGDGDGVRGRERGLVFCGLDGKVLVKNLVRELEREEEAVKGVVKRVEAVMRVVDARWAGDGEYEDVGEGDEVECDVVMQMNSWEVGLLQDVPAAMELAGTAWNVGIVV